MRKLLKWFSSTDQRAALYIFRHWRHRRFEQWLAKLTHLGDAWFAISTMCMLSILTRFDYRGLLSLTLSHIIVELIKRIVTRQRPYDNQKQIVLYGMPLKDYSFPSGHTSAAFTMASALSFTIPALFIFFYSLAVIVGFSRVYLGYHYPTDTIIGASIGISSTVAVYLVI